VPTNSLSNSDLCYPHPLAIGGQYPTPLALQSVGVGGGTEGGGGSGEGRPVSQLASRGEGEWGKLGGRWEAIQSVGKGHRREVGQGGGQWLPLGP
jgi:hypothetical protein